MAQQVKSTRGSHSIRADNQLWARAHSKAKAEGKTLNYVIEEILEGYVRGMISPPKIVKQYTKASPPPAS